MLVAGTALVAVVAVVADGAPLRAPDDGGRADLPDRLLAALEVAVLVGGGPGPGGDVVISLSGAPEPAGSS